MLTDDDYVLYKGADDNIYSEGYRINNIFKNADMPALISSENPLGCSNINNLAIPAGLIYMHSMIKDAAPEDNTNIDVEVQAAPEELYSALLKLVEIKTSNKKNKTKKRSKRRSKKKSRKNN